MAYLLHLDIFKMQIIIIIIIITITIITIYQVFRCQWAFIFPLKPLHPRRKVFISHDRNTDVLQSWNDCFIMGGILPFSGNKFIFCSHVNGRPALAATCFGILINFYLIYFERKYIQVRDICETKQTQWPKCTYMFILLMSIKQRKPSVRNKGIKFNRVEHYVVFSHFFCDQLLAL